MKRKQMETVIFWLAILGPLVIGTAGAAWYGGNKIIAIWMAFAGVVLLLIALALQIQRAVSVEQSLASDGEVRRLRAYVFVEGSEIRNFGTSRPVEGWVSLRNTGLTPATGLRRIASIITAVYPHTDFIRVPLGDARAVLAPNGAVDFGPIRMPRALTPAENVSIIAGRVAIYVYGEIKYIDDFGIERCTNFRLMYRGNGTVPGPGVLPLEQVNEGNDFECR